MAVTKDSPLKPYFERNIVNLMQGGLIEQFMNRQTYLWVNELDNEEMLPIDISHLFIALAAYISCIILSSLVFMSENLHEKANKLKM